MITSIYKVAGDSNEYHSEQEAMVAETIQKLPCAYLSAGEKQEIAEAICKKFYLHAIPQPPLDQTSFDSCESLA